MVNGTTVFPLTKARIDRITHSFVKHIPSENCCSLGTVLQSWNTFKDPCSQGDRQYTTSIINKLYSTIKAIRAVRKEKEESNGGQDSQGYG